MSAHCQLWPVRRRVQRPTGVRLHPPGPITQGLYNWAWWVVFGGSGRLVRDVCRTMAVLRDGSVVGVLKSTARTWTYH